MICYSSVTVLHIFVLLSTTLCWWIKIINGIAVSCYFLIDCLTESRRTGLRIKRHRDHYNVVSILQATRVASHRYESRRPTGYCIWRLSEKYRNVPWRSLAQYRFRPVRIITAPIQSPLAITSSCLSCTDIELRTSQSFYRWSALSCLFDHINVSSNVNPMSVYNNLVYFLTRPY